MEQFMNEDPRELGPGAIEADGPPAEKRSGMDRTAAVAKASRLLNGNWLSCHRRQATQQWAGLLFERSIFEYKKPRGR
jgi:hypothetical protein